MWAVRGPELCPHPGWPSLFCACPSLGPPIFPASHTPHYQPGLCHTVAPRKWEVGVPGPHTWGGGLDRGGVEKGHKPLGYDAHPKCDTQLCFLKHRIGDG